MRRRTVLALGAGVAVAATAHAAGTALRWLQVGDVGGLAMTEGLAGAGAGAVEVLGNRGLWLLDTGAEIAIVNPALATELKLRRSGTRRIRAIGTQPKSAPVVEPLSLRVGEASLELHEAAVLDLSAHTAAIGEPVQGFVGWPTLGALDWSMDPAGRRWSPDRAAVHPRAFELARRPDHALPVVSGSMGARAPVPLLLDTGFAGALMLWGDAARALGAGARAGVRIDVQGIGGSTTISAVLLGRLRLGDAEWLDVPTLLLSAPVMPGVQGALGMALFDGGLLGHDAARRRVWTTAGATAAPLPGGFGVVLGAAAGQLVAQQVMAGSPAALAGVLPGDVLIGIDETPLRRAVPAAAWEQVGRAAQARFAWRRADEERTTPLRRERFFARTE